MDDLEKLQILEEFQSWISHPYTSKVIAFLEKERQLTMENAQFLSCKMPIDKDAVILDVQACHILDKVSKKLKEPIILK
jgi:hypothetical protein